MKDWAIRSVTSYSRSVFDTKVDYGRHSETERVLVDNEGLAIQSLLKIQSGPLGNLGDQPFDGDEMNMHMPQNILAETELRHLAAIPYQIISPTSNSPIIGIYQDNMLGSYRFTRPNIKLGARDAMNLLMMFPNVDVKTLYDNRKTLTSFDILSQIMPPITLKYETKLFEEGEDKSTSNNVMEIRNGQYMRGQMEKGVLGSGTKGILHRIFNDYGHMECARFIDNLQNVVTEYMKSSAFSVGISDLVANKKTQEQIIRIIHDKKSEVQMVVDKVHLGIFENDTSNTNMVQFETTVNNILNQATAESGKEGRKSLNKDNRFVMIVNSGSKGSLLNISQMISCLGQQNIDAKRIPYGFDSRTLPHFNKFDDSPEARGFIENSYISGLSATDLFFHAMGGRIGLIDTACKSVTWETPIVIIENDQPKYIEIGKWIDSLLDCHKESIQHFTEREMELLHLENPVYIPTTDEKGNVSWGEVTDITRHDPGIQLYEIKTAGGRKVIVTESKSLLIWDKTTESLLETSTPDIKVGDYVPVTGELCEPPVILNEINGIILNKETGYKFGIDIAENNKVIPCEAFISNNDFIVGLLSGYFTDKININKNNISVNSNSLRQLEGINMLLSRLGIYGKISGSYILTISGRSAIKFSEIINNVDLLEYDSSSDEDIYNNIVLDKIEEINLVDIKDHPKVYDLTIPSTLNFGLANGLQVRDTSQTGYIQRRLIKGLEDLKVEYDMTVRNNRGKIVQFAYGDDGFDSTKVENQAIPIVGMSIEDIYMHYDIIGINDTAHASIQSIYTKGTANRMKKQREETMIKTKIYIEMMLESRETVIQNIFKYKNDKMVRVPVAFQYIITNIQHQLGLNSRSITDITPLEAFQLIENTFDKLKKIHFAPPTPLFKILYYYYLSPRDLLVNKRFHRKGLELLLETVVLKYKQALVHPGEMVGVIAGQSIGEPTTQLTLNSVTYETEIVVRNNRNEIKKVQIGDFVTQHMEKSLKKEYMAKQDTTYAELNPDEEYYEIPSANESGETVWTRIEAVTQHPVINADGTDTMLKITTEGCREVIVTKAKSVLQLVDGKISEVSGEDIKIGDFLPASKKPLEYQEVHVLDVRDILPPTKYLYGSEYHKAASFMKEPRWWTKHSGKDFIVPHSRSDSFVELTKANKIFDPECVYMKLVNMCDYNVPAEIPLDYDFGYLVGAYCAEGCMTAHQISIANNDLDYLKPIERLCQKWNITTKIYCDKDKNQKGWTSQNLRIYNTVLCRILESLCGKLSHNKFVSEKIVFSNKDCILGFLDAYIAGDGCIHKSSTGTHRICDISMTSVSKTMLTDVMIMLKNLGIVATMRMPKKIEKNNRGSQNIKQHYILSVKNQQSQKLGAMLHLPIKSKQDRIDVLLQQTFKYEYDASFMTVPNKIGGEIVFENREKRFSDMLFDRVVKIEDVSNTTKYAYDLTVAETRNFDCINGLCLRDTFHLAGVSTKSNVTRGVPRIEEILRLTDNPKRPALTIHLKPIDETDKDRASAYATMIEHTKLIDVVDSVQICFDPNDDSSFIKEDKHLIDQFYEFERIVKECSEEQDSPETQKSKWMIRLAINPTSLLDKNITMDDIHFAITTNYPEITCIYSDYNDSNLVFRIRINQDSFKKKKGSVASLDQSDEIYLLKNLQDTILNHIVLRGISGLKNILPRKIQNMVIKEEGKFVTKDTWVLDTTGTNLMDILALDFIDSKRTYSNDMNEVFSVLGIEAARQIIFNEFSEVMEFSDVYINYHHLSLLCDRMTMTKDMVAIFRSGLHKDDIGPIAKATFEVHTEILLDAARHADFDDMRGVSANVMCGQTGYYGTGAFNILLDMHEIGKLEASDVKVKKDDEIEELFGLSEEIADTCSKQNIMIQNHISAIHQEPTGFCEDTYNMGF